MCSVAVLPYLPISQSASELGRSLGLQQKRNVVNYPPFILCGKTVVEYRSASAHTENQTGFIVNRQQLQLFPRAKNEALNRLRLAWNRPGYYISFLPKHHKLLCTTVKTRQGNCHQWRLPSILCLLCPNCLRAHAR